MEKKNLSDEQIDYLMKKAYRKLKPHYCHFRFYAVPDVSLSCFKQAAEGYRAKSDFEHQILVLDEVAKCAHNMKEFEDEAVAYKDKAFAYSNLLLVKNDESNKKKISNVIESLNLSGQCYRIIKNFSASNEIYSEIVQKFYIPNKMLLDGFQILFKGLKDNISFVKEENFQSLEQFHKSIHLLINLSIELNQNEQCIIKFLREYFSMLINSNCEDKNRIKSLFVIIIVIYIISKEFEDIDKFMIEANEIEINLSNEIEIMNDMVYSYKNLIRETFEKNQKKISIYNIPIKLENRLLNSFGDKSNNEVIISSSKEEEIKEILKQNNEENGGFYNDY